MAPRKQPGLGAMREIRQELQEAAAERKDLDLRIRRLRAAEAALHGARSPHAKVLSTEQIKAYLAAHPGSRSLEIADALRAPATNVRTLLTAAKKRGEVTNDSQRWYLAKPGRASTRAKTWP